MEHWVCVKATDVINVFEKTKTGFPWGNYLNEKYRCLIFWYNNRIHMTVDEFYKSDETTYACCRFYTTELCHTIDEYKRLSDEQLSSKAYNAWCTDAR